MSPLQLGITYTPDKCTANIDGRVPLTHLAFAVESIASYFFGCAVSRFACERTSPHHPDCQLTFTALDEPGPMRLSKVASVGSAVREGLWPRKIPENACFQAEENRIRKNKIDAEPISQQITFYAPEEYLQSSCIIVGHEYKSDAPLSEIAYGMSDMFTGLFALGVKKIKWQGSLLGSQLHFSHNLDNKQILGFLGSSKDYDINRKVCTLE